MASLIKNQIIKHLSKFAKNLNPDNITVDVLKGKGALYDLELNEALLTDALELPLWLKVEKIVCNQVALKIPWTSLKTQPIVLFMDEVRVDVVMSSNLRESKNASNLISSYSNIESSGYGFVNKVLEGMTLNINLLEIFFSSEIFGGSLILNQLQIIPCTPFWKPIPETNSDLRQTRISEKTLHEVLVFKLITWQLLRVEASALAPDSNIHGHNINAPLRFITSQGRVQISMKKSTISGALLTGRMQIILNDLLWVATLSQVRSAISFYRYILKLVQTATDLYKTQKAENTIFQVKNSGSAATTVAAGKSPNLSGLHQKSGGPMTSSGVPMTSSSINAVYKQFDIVETSYHFYADCIDLHICDEASGDFVYPENWNFKSGALQITLTKLICDFYPYHLAGGGRNYWVYYNGSNSQQWMKHLLEHHFNLFKRENKFLANSEQNWSKLMSQCVLLRLHDFKIYCVSESTEKTPNSGPAPKTGQKTPAKKLELFLSSDKEILQLPGNMPLITLEFADYYYPTSFSDMPVPPRSTHVQMNPMRIFVDLRTIRWMSYLYLDLCKNLGLDSNSIESVPHGDVRLEAIMLRVIVPSQNESCMYQSKINKDCLIINISSYIFTNCLISCSENLHKHKLSDYLTTLNQYHLFNGLFKTGQSDKAEKAELKTNDQSGSKEAELLKTADQSGSGKEAGLKFRQIPTNSDAIKLFAHQNFNENIRSRDEYENLCKSAINDLWLFELNPIWIDFSGQNVSKFNKYTPLVIDSNVIGWSLLGNNNNNQSDSTTSRDLETAKYADLYVFVKPLAKLKLVLDHNQYLFLMRLIDQINNFTMLLNQDAKIFYSNLEAKSLICMCLADLIDIHVILPTTPPSGGPIDQSQSGVVTSSSIGSSTNDQQAPGVGGVGEESPTNENRPSDGGFVSNTSGSMQISSKVDDVIQTSDIDSPLDQNFDANKNIQQQEIVEFVVEYATAIGRSTPVYSVGGADDAISIGTDLSDEEVMNFIDLTDSNSLLFEEIFRPIKTRPQPGVGQGSNSSADLAEEACEKVSLSGSNVLNNAQVAQKQVTVVVCKLFQTQFLFTNYDQESHSTIKCPKLEIIEMYPQTFEQLYASLNAKSQPKTEALEPVKNDYVIKICVNNDDSSSSSGVINGELHNFGFKLSSDSLAALGQFFRDDSAPSLQQQQQAKPSPIQLQLKNLHISLTDQAVLEPILLKIDRASILQGVEDSSLSTFNDQNFQNVDHVSKINELEQENIKLKQKLADAKKLIEEILEKKDKSGGF